MIIKKRYLTLLLAISSNIFLHGDDSTPRAGFLLFGFTPEGLIKAVIGAGKACALSSIATYGFQSVGLEFKHRLTDPCIEYIKQGLTPPRSIYTGLLVTNLSETLGVDNNTPIFQSSPALTEDALKEIQETKKDNLVIALYGTSGAGKSQSIPHIARVLGCKLLMPVTQDTLMNFAKILGENTTNIQALNHLVSNASELADAHQTKTLIYVDDQTKRANPTGTEEQDIVSFKELATKLKGTNVHLAFSTNDQVDPEKDQQVGVARRQTSIKFGPTTEEQRKNFIHNIPDIVTHEGKNYSRQVVAEHNDSQPRTSLGLIFDSMWPQNKSKILQEKHFVSEKMIKNRQKEWDNRKKELETEQNNCNKRAENWAWYDWTLFQLNGWIKIDAPDSFKAIRRSRNTIQLANYYKEQIKAQEKHVIPSLVTAYGISKLINDEEFDEEFKDKFSSLTASLKGLGNDNNQLPVTTHDLAQVVKKAAATEFTTVLAPIAEAFEQKVATPANKNHLIVFPHKLDLWEICENKYSQLPQSSSFTAGAGAGAVESKESEDSKESGALTKATSGEQDDRKVRFFVINKETRTIRPVFRKKDDPRYDLSQVIQKQDRGYTTENTEIIRSPALVNYWTKEKIEEYKNSDSAKARKIIPSWWGTPTVMINYKTGSDEYSLKQKEILAPTKASVLFGDIGKTELFKAIAESKSTPYNSKQ